MIRVGIEGCTHSGRQAGRLEENMSDQQKDISAHGGRDETPTAAVREKPLKAPALYEPRQLPPYKVSLHNDDVNEENYVVHSILKVTHLSLADAETRMREAHKTGLSLLLVTHKERAELYQEQFATFNLTVTIEPDA